MAKIKVKIEVISGVYDGACYEFTEFPVTIGRMENQDVSLAYDTVISKNHAQIIVDDGNSNVYVVDNDSTNGTILQKTRVEGQHRILSGDVVKVGNTSFRCTIDNY